MLELESQVRNFTECRGAPGVQSCAGFVFRLFIGSYTHRVGKEIPEFGDRYRVFSRVYFMIFGGD